MFGAIMLLPGAALTFAQQEGNTASKSFVAPAAKAEGPTRLLFDSPRLLPELIGNEAKSTSPNDKETEKTSFQVESIDIKNLVNKLQETERVSPEQLVEELLARLPSPNSQAELTVEIEGRAVKLGGDQPSLKVIGSMLYVAGTEKERSMIRTYLEHYRCLGDQILVFEVRIVELPTKSLDGLSFRSDSERTTQGLKEPNQPNENEVVAASFESKRVATANKVSQFDASQIEELLASDGCQIISAPKISTFNAQSAQVTIGSEHPFVVGYTPVIGEDGKPTDTLQPKIELVLAGINLKLEGRVIENDPSKLTVYLTYTDTKIGNVVSYTHEQDGHEHTIQQPSLNRRFIETGVEQKLGSTFAVEVEPELVETIVEKRVPVLEKIPYVNRFFKNVAKHSELRTRLVLVNCRLVDGATESEDAFSQPGQSDLEKLDDPKDELKVNRRPISK